MKHDVANIDELIKVLIKKGFKDKKVLSAIANVAREKFIDPNLKHRAYEDFALPIGKGQTISQPYTVAIMTSALELTGTEKVLEIGTGSGYQTAILSKLASKIYTVERIKELYNHAKQLLSSLGYNNIEYYENDGSLGLLNAAPFDAIIVTAAAPKIPHQLFMQLNINGRLVIPVGEKESQEMQLIRKVGEGKYDFSTIGKFKFVPLIGQDAWGVE